MAAPDAVSALKKVSLFAQPGRQPDQHGGSTSECADVRRRRTHRETRGYRCRRVLDHPRRHRRGTERPGHPCDARPRRVLRGNGARLRPCHPPLGRCCSHRRRSCAATHPLGPAWFDSRPSGDRPCRCWPIWPIEFARLMRPWPDASRRTLRSRADCHSRWRAACRSGRRRTPHRYPAPGT